MPVGSTNPITIRMLGNTTVTANFIPHGTGGTGTDPARVLAERHGHDRRSLTSN